MPPMTHVAAAPQHLLSVARVALGALLSIDVRTRGQSEWALPAAILAVVFDVADGRLARARGTSSTAGRVIDNACDAVFLGLTFSAFTREIGSAPIVFLLLSFGSYGVRALAAAVTHGPFTPSPRGRWAGIVNYVLAVVVAAEVHPRIDLPSAPISATVLAVVLLNALALYDNARLAWVDGHSDKRAGASS